MNKETQKCEVSDDLFIRFIKEYKYKQFCEKSSDYYCEKCDPFTVTVMDADYLNIFRCKEMTIE